MRRFAAAAAPRNLGLAASMVAFWVAAAVPAAATSITVNHELTGPITAEACLARARESIWTPEKEKPEQPTKLWTPGSKETA